VKVAFEFRGRRRTSVGFAVSADATRAAGYTGAQLAEPALRAPGRTLVRYHHQTRLKGGAVVATGDFVVGGPRERLPSRGRPRPGSRTRSTVTSPGRDEALMTAHSAPPVSAKLAPVSDGETTTPAEFDLDLGRTLLSLSPGERLRRHDQALALVLSARRAGELWREQQRAAQATDSRER
jgi:hypothetical protein